MNRGVYLVAFFTSFCFANTIEIKQVFSPSDLTFGKVKDVDRIAMLHCVCPFKPGEPALPAKSLHVFIPHDQEFESIEIKTTSTKEIGKFNIEPKQKEKPLHSVGDTSTLRNIKIYSSDAEFPGRLVELKHIGSLGGYRIASFLLYPLQYCPKSGKLKLLTDIVFVIKTESRKKKADDLVIEYRSAQSEEVYCEAVKNLVLNSKDVVPISYGKGEFTSQIPYIVITQDSFKSRFQPLVDWKTKKGWYTQMLSVDWIGQHYNGRDIQEKIRNCIKDYYQNHGTVWVLLGGGSNNSELGNVPCRLWHETAEGESPTDLYFSDLDRSWDEDNDNKFGEVQDNIDFYPDVFLGRAPVLKRDHVQTFVNKLLYYERNPDPAFVEKCFFMAFDADWQTQNEWGKEWIHAWGYIPSNFAMLREYDSESGDHEEDCKGKFNSGQHFVNHIDHGAFNKLGVGYEYHNDWLDKDEILALGGPGIAIVYSTACDVGWFNLNQECPGSCFIFNASGAVAFIGNAGSGFYWSAHPGEGVSERYDQRYYFEFTLAKRIRLGNTFALHKAAFISLCQSDNEYRRIQAWLNLFGDPEMPIWSGRPSSLTSAWAESRFPGDISVYFTPSHYALVGLYMNEYDIHLYASDVWPASFSNPVVEEGMTLYYTISKGQSTNAYFGNYYPYEGSVNVPGCPYNLTAIVNENGLTLNWAYHSSYVERFTVQRRVGSGNWEERGRPNYPPFPDNPDPGITYEYRVASVCGSILSNPSNSVYIIRPWLNAPTGLVVGNILPTSVTISWNDQSALEDGYEIHRAIETGGFTYHSEVGQNQTGFTDVNLESGKKYRYKVRAFKNESEVRRYSDFSNEVYATPGQTGNSRDSLATSFNNGNRVAIDGSGCIHIVYSMKVGDYEYQGFYRASTDGGNTFSDALPLIPPSYPLSAEPVYAVITVDAANNPHIVYAYRQPKGSNWWVDYVHLFRTTNEAGLYVWHWSNILHLSYDIQRPDLVSPPAICIAGDSIFVAVNRYDQGTNYWRAGVAGHELSNTAGTFTWYEFSNIPYYDPCPPSIAYDKGGRLVVAFGSHRTSFGFVLHVCYRGFGPSSPWTEIYEIDEQYFHLSSGKDYVYMGVSSHGGVVYNLRSYIFKWVKLLQRYVPIEEWKVVEPSRARTDYGYSQNVAGRYFVYENENRVFVRARHGDEWGPRILVSPSATSNNFFPQSAWTTDGWLRTLWTKRISTNDNIVVFKKTYTNSWPTPLTAKNNARKILRDYCGNLHRAWFDNYPPWDTLPLAVFYSVSSDVGQSWDTTYIGEGIFPALATSEDGEKKVIAWLDETEKYIIYSFKDSSSYFWAQPCTIAAAPPMVSSEVYSAPSISFCYDTVHIGFKARTEILAGWFEDNIKYLRFPYNDPQSQYTEVVDSWTPDSLSFPDNPRTRAPSIATDYYGIPYMTWARPPDQYEPSDIYYGVKMASEWTTGNISVSSDSSTCPSIECYGGNISVVWAEKVNSDYAVIRYLAYAGGEGFRVDTVTVTTNVAKYPTISKEYVLWEEETEANPLIMGRRWDAMGEGWGTQPQVLSNTEYPSLYAHSEVWMDFFNLYTFSFWTEVAGETLRLKQNFTQEPLMWGFAGTGFPFPYYYMELGDSTPFTHRRTGGITLDSVKCDYAKDSLIYFLPHTDTSAKYRVTLELYLPQAKSGSRESDAFEVHDPETAGLDIRKGESWVRVRVDSRIQTNVKLKPGINRFTYWVPQTIIAKNARLILKKLSGSNVYCHRIIWEQYEKPKEQALAGGSGVQEDEGGKIPFRFYLKAPRPNPFNRRTTIDYGLARPSRVRMRIYDVTGRVVATVKHKVEAAGIYRLQWDAKNVASGVYFVELEAGTYLNRKKVVLAR